MKPPEQLFLRVDGGSRNQPGLYFALPTMPNRFHRLIMRVLLGWRVVHKKDMP